ncbi:MAG: autotransporter outer membrane beta-barrel domain-containing protein [Parvibaculum sp.]|nr:autotransporter outer membrane beta-barrel domain-containing protein [Parvibaculum sp.]
MHIHSKFRRQLLGSSALVAGAFFMATSAAHADIGGSCDGGPVADGVTITCSGNVEYSIEGDASDVTVTINADANVYANEDRVIDLFGNGNTVTLGTDSAVGVYGDNKAVNFDGNDNVMTLNSGSQLYLGLDGSNSGTAIDIDGDNVDLTLNGGSSIDIYGSTSSNNAQTFAVNAYGAGNTLTLNGASEVSLDIYNENKYASSTGIVMGGEASTLTLNGGSTVSVETYNRQKYAETIGVEMSGADNVLTLNGGSVINVEAYNDAKYSETTGVTMYGESNTLTLNSGSAITVDTYNDDRDSETFGVIMRGDYASLALNGGSSVTVNADGGESSGETVGVQIESFDPSVTLNDTSTINVNGTGDSHNSSYVGLSVSSYGEDSSAAGLVTLNGSSSVNVTLSGEDVDNPWAAGVVLGGDRRRARAKYASYAPSLTLNGSSSINVLGTNEYSNSDGTYEGILIAGDEGVITLNGTSSINVDSAGDLNLARGINIYGDNTTVVMNGASSINIGQDDGDFEIRYGYGIDARGEGASITLNDTASIDMNTNVATGVRLRDDYSSLTMNGDSSVRVAYYGNGVVVDETVGTTVTLNDNSTIRVNYDDGIVLSEGANNAVTLNDNASVISLDGNGVSFDEQKYSSLTLNDNAMIIAAYGNGVVINGSEDTTITLNGSSSIVAGNGRAGILVTGQSSYYDNDSYSWVYLGNQNTTININKGTSVVGGTGIRVEDDAQFTAINVAGFVGGTGGTAIDFSDAMNSSLYLNTGAEIIGSIAGSSISNDRLYLNGQGVLASTVTNFDYLSVSGEKGDIWNLTSNLNLGSGYAEIVSGELAVNGILTADDIYVGVGGTLGGSGTVIGNVDVDGTVAPGNSPGTLNVVGNVTFNPGSGFKVQVEGNQADLLNVTGGNVTINPGTAITMEFLGGVDGFVGDVITTTGTVTGTFSTFNGGVFDYSGPGVVSLTSASPASVNTGMTGGTTMGFTFLDAVIGNAEDGVGQNRGIWGTGLYNQTNRSGMGTTRGADIQSQGLAMGGDVFGSDGFSVGVAGGYIDTTATTEGGGSETGIKGYNVAAYTSYGMGNTFMTAAVTGAYQEQDVSRRVLVLGTVSTANSSPEAWTAGAGFSIGHTIPIQGSWTIVPRASLGWQHLARDGYSETGGGTAAMSIQDVSSDTVRGQVGAELGFTIKDPNAAWSVRPSVRAALAKELRSGDSTVNGRFLTSGAAFSGNTDSRDQTYAAVGAGVDVVVGGGITAFAQYDGAVGGDYEKSGGVRVGARFEW